MARMHSSRPPSAPGAPHHNALRAAVVAGHHVAEALLACRVPLQGAQQHKRLAL
jgi:hypothetical protein